MPENVAFSNRPDNSTILGAAKITGRTSSGWSIGLVEAVTAEERAPFLSTTGENGEAVVEPRTNYLAARAEKLMRSGQSAVGGIMTAVNRDLSDNGLTDLLRSSAYSGGLDFSHEFANRTWFVSGYFAYSRINGTQPTILRAQYASARYFQRPDADYLEIDSTLTSLEGYAARLAINKTAGLHWRGDANISAISPGFEVNDIGFQTAADRLGTDINVSYVENRPGPLFRNYRVNLRNAADMNFGGDVVAARSTLSFNYQLVNYWGGHVNWTHSFDAYDDRLTRGGPVARDLSDNRIEVQLNSDGRKRVSTRFTANHNWSESGGWSTQANGSVTVRPAENWSVTLGPRLNRQRTAAQYLGYEDDAAAVATFSRRYVFAPISQTTFSVETRLNMTFTPEVSFELFAQPFVSTGDYGDVMQLRRPRAFEFDPYGGAMEPSDFNTRSLRGNAVMRWEWKPGSTLFLVWQQRRSGSFDSGRFDLSRDARAIFNTRPNNVFLVKMNYWLNL
jgi:hypothetical protein